MPGRPLFLFLSASLLAGCAAGPDYAPPGVAVSPRFLAQDGVESRQVQGKAALQSWWAGFEDPLLSRVVTVALQQNLDIAQAAARVAQSRASLRQADAALLPSAEVRGQAAKVYQSVETARGELGVHLVSDGGTRPYRAHFRDPSFVNLQMLRDMSIGGYVADLIQNLGMLDPILGGIDR